MAKIIAPGRSCRGPERDIASNITSVKDVIEDEDAYLIKID